MKARNAAGKINGKPTVSENVSPNEGVVWRRESQAYDINLDAGGWKKESDSVAVGKYGFTARFSDFDSIDWAEVEFVRQARSYRGHISPGINLGTNIHPANTQKRHRSNANHERWAMFDKVIDRLSKIEFGPNGFFIICHADPPHASARNKRPAS